MLSEENRHEYLKDVYAAWLGKVIGVRLGSPVENWSHEKIMSFYPDEEGYLVDYDIYAADDDTNGPLFFVRALLDNEEITAETIGDTFLNYLQEYKGFFWWGGVGVSTEHTAYENLKNGIKAPLSGSIETNGQTMAEQIGGQIFSDCWAYVAGYDVQRAVDLAAMASSVTHDRNGIEGGKFVAAAITLAMKEKDIHKVIEDALKYLNKDLEYYQVAREILSFYENNKENWQKCLSYIQKNHGYDKYPGTCHIIPNMALMIMAMSYGEGDFSRTLVMLNRCGWDTDCNCGNVGSIMGALVGLKGIDEKWITPINDVLNASSAIGFLNIQTVSESAKLFTKLAYKLEGLKEPFFPLFELPYATKGIRCNEGKVCVKDYSLHVESKDIYAYAYYLSRDIYDARYDPEFSAILNPNDRIEVSVKCEESQVYTFYMEDCDRLVHEYETVPKDGKIFFDLPYGKNMVVHKVGLKAYYPYEIEDVRVLHRPMIEHDFTSFSYEHYGPRYAGSFMNNIRSYVGHSGDWKLSGGLLGTSKEHGLISNGCYGNRYHELSWTFEPIQGEEHLLIFNMKGYLDRYGIGLRNDELVLVEYKEEESTIASYPLSWDKGKIYELTLKDETDRLLVKFDGKEYAFEKMELRDLYGFALGKESQSRTLSFKARY